MERTTTQGANDMSKILYQIRQILRGGITSRNIHEFKRLTALLHVHAGEPVALTWPTKAAAARMAAAADLAATKELEIRVATKASAAWSAGDAVRVQAICLRIADEWHLCRGDLPWAL